MAAPAAPAWSSALADAIRAGDRDATLAAGLRAVEARAPHLEVARAGALAYASSVDVSPEYPPHGFLALSAAVRLARHLPPNLAPLPVLQALTLAAADGKLPASEHRRRTAVAGEISHLTRSFEYAVRTGAFGDAVSIFSGLLREGRERVMAGDVLFRVAAEDMVMAGHKLIYAVKGWQLASALGWRAGDVVMGPAVARVATRIQDPTAFRTLMAAWGREKVDLAAVGGNAGPAEGAERAAIREALRATTPDACAAGVVLALKRGVALDAIAGVAVEEAADRVAGLGSHDLVPVHGLIFADLARWVLAFSRTESRVYPLLQACLLLQSQSAFPALRPEARSSGHGDLRTIAGAMEAGRAREAGEAVHGYVALGADRPRFLELLAVQACRDDPSVTMGHNLILADAAIQEATAHPASASPALVALAHALALSPRARGNWAVLERRFPPATAS